VTLGCWYDRWLAERQDSESRIHERPVDPKVVSAGAIADSGPIEPAEVRVSVIFPAYNEEDRVLPTLEEAVTYLDETVGRPGANKLKTPASSRRQKRSTTSDAASGYEIIVVDDGSKDTTVDVCLAFAKKHDLHDILRVVKLEKNRGKGGAVTHGMRHARGEYVLFADADGASRFSDLGRLIEGCEEVVDGAHRGVAIGSRAHLVGSEAVVKVCSIPFFTSSSITC
jgi:dolichyl-phosphate beta-glucosyltransferase